MIKEYKQFIKDYLAIAQIKIVYVMINFISAIFYKGFDLLSPLVASLIVKYLTEGNAEMTYLFLGLLFLVYFLYKVCLYINYRIYAFNANYCYDKLTSKILKKLIGVDQNFTRVISKGKLMNSINSDIIEVGEMNDCISEIFAGVLQIAGVIIIVMFYHLYLGLLLIAFSFIYIYICNTSDRKLNYYHSKVKIQDDRYSNLLVQMLSGLQEIKTFDMLPKLTRKLSQIQNSFTKNYKKKRYYGTIRDNDVNIVIYIFRFILYILLIYLIMNHRYDVSILVLIIAYHESLVECIDDVLESTEMIRQTSTAVGRINDILNYNSKEIPYGKIDTKDIYGMIEFKDVSLSIKKKQVLSNINLKIDHNEVVAIVGESGSGKTMLFNLILRLFKPTKGKITIDNIDIFEFSKESYSNNISVINQKPFIFNMSIRKNLNFVDRNIKNQIEACKKAGIHNFIETLPNGYNTVL